MATVTLQKTSWHHGYVTATVTVKGTQAELNGAILALMASQKMADFCRDVNNDTIQLTSDQNVCLDEIMDILEGR